MSEQRLEGRLPEKETEFKESGNRVSRGVEGEAGPTCGRLGCRGTTGGAAKDCGAYLFL